MAKKTLTLYLAKPDVENFDNLLTENGIDKLSHRTTRIIEPEGFGDQAKIYIFVGPASEPNFMKTLRSEFDIGAQVKAKSVCALLMFEIRSRIFIATFSYAWMYLNAENIEGDFGLRVAINALNDKKLKRLERANLGDALRGISQSPFQRDFNSFGVDDALDLIRNISGITKESVSADSLTGATSLRISGDYEIEELPELSIEAFNLYSSASYQQSSFKVLDTVSPINDARLIKLLDNLAITSIQNNERNFELGLPSTSEKTSVAYKFSGPRLRGRYPDLLLDHYVSALGDGIHDIDSQRIKDHKIIAIHEDDSYPNQKWSIHRALVGSISYDGARYAINEGSWYQIDQQFKQSIEDRFLNVFQQWENPWRPLRKIYDDDGNGRFQSEETYNAEISDEYNLILLDQRLIQIPNIQRSGFEACDLLDLENRKLIHVKKSSRRSSVLSHFFKQGSNSAQQLRKFSSAVDALRNVLSNLTDVATANRFRDDFNSNENSWTVEYVIADTPRAIGPRFNIPFFSKITLRDEATNLAAMNFGVALKFIALQPDNIE